MKSTVLGIEGTFVQLLDIFAIYGDSSPNDQRMKFIYSFLVENDGGNLKVANDWLRLTYAPAISPEKFANGWIMIDGEERSHFNLAIEELLNDLRKDFPETVPK